MNEYEFNPTLLVKKRNIIKKNITTILTSFRLIDSKNSVKINEYYDEFLTYEKDVVFHFCNLNYIYSLISNDQYIFIREKSLYTNIDKATLEDVILEYQKLVEICICIKSEMQIIMQVYSTKKFEEIKLLIDKFINNRDYLISNNIQYI